MYESFLKTPVYILGMRDNFRGENLHSSLSEIGYSNIVRIYGVDARQASAKLRKYRSNLCSTLLIGRKLTDGEIACSLGHQEIYRRFNKSGEDLCLILEDDAHIDSDISLWLEEFSTFEEPSILQLHSSKSSASKTLKSIRQLDSPTPKTHGYLLNKRGVEVIIESLRRTNKIFSTADWPHIWSHKLSFFESSMNVVSADDLNSSLEAERAEITSRINYVYRIMIKSHLIGVLHRIGLTSFLFFLQGFSFLAAYEHLVAIPRKKKIMGEV